MGAAWAVSSRIVPTGKVGPPWYGHPSLLRCQIEKRSLAPRALVEGSSLALPVAVLPSKDSPRSPPLAKVSDKAKPYTKCLGMDVQNRSLRSLLPPQGPPLRRHHGGIRTPS